MEGMLSPADVAVLSGNNRNGSNDGFGDGGAWWVIIFLIFAFGGWGGRGFGNNGGGSSMGAADNYVLASDFAQISRQLDSGFDRIGNRIENVNNGLCDGFYSINTAFGNLNTTLCTQFGNTINAITQNGYESRLATQGLSSQLENCCCGLRSDIAGVNYNMAINNNALQAQICNSTRDIVDSQTAGTRAILDAITANRIEDKNAQIQAQQNEINALRLAASQEKQNAYLVDKLNPNVCPVPAYLTCNPNAPLNYSISYGNCGCNNGCGNY